MARTNVGAVAKTSVRRMEISPQYCQVIIDRWEKLTGQKAEKVDA